MITSQESIAQGNPWMLQTKMRSGNDTDESKICRFKRVPIDNNGLTGRELTVEDSRMDWEVWFVMSNTGGSRNEALEC